MICGSPTERNRTKLRDTPSSVKTPQASGESEHKLSGKPGEADGLRSGIKGSGKSPGREQGPSRLRTLPSAPGSVTPRGARPVEGVGLGKAGHAAPPAAPRGLGGGVSYLGQRTQGFRAEGSGLAQSRDPQGSTLSGAAAACPSPAADCGGTRARLRSWPAG